MENFLSFMLTIVGILSAIFMYVHKNHMDRYKDDWQNLNKLRESLKDIDADNKFMQELALYSVKCIRGLDYIKTKVVIFKDISLRDLTAIANMNRKSLCSFDSNSDIVTLVSKKEYRKIRYTDILFIITTIIFFMTIISFIVHVVFGTSILVHVLLFLLIMITELIWLSQDNPYGYYRALIKDSATLSNLKQQQVIVSGYNYNQEELDDNHSTSSIEHFDN